MAEPTGSKGPLRRDGTDGTTQPAEPDGPPEDAARDATTRPDGHEGTAQLSESDGPNEAAARHATTRPDGHEGMAQPSERDPAERVSVSTHVDAPAADVYDLVADLPRMGQWSPECTSVAWRGGATSAAVGARFRGWNRKGPVRWFTDGVVVVAEPGRALVFEISGLGRKVARWAYQFEPDDDVGGCTVTEHWTDLRSPGFRAVTGVIINVRDRPSHNRAGMEHTLARVKAAAEVGR